MNQQEKLYLFQESIKEYFVLNEKATQIIISLMVSNYFFTHQKLNLSMGNI
jgi:hypothetical protein